MEHKQKIIEMLDSVKSEGILEYLEEFIRMFLRRWG